MSAYFWATATRQSRELSTALHLMPFEPLRHISFIGIGCAHFAAGRYDRAIRWVVSGIQASLRESFWAQRVAVAAAAMTGAHSEARRMARQLMCKDPNLTVAEARQAWPFTLRCLFPALVTAWKSQGSLEAEKLSHCHRPRRRTSSQ